MMLVHPLIQVARGYLADENWRAAEEVLGRAVAVAKDLEDENKRLVLVRELADAEERLAESMQLETVARALAKEQVGNESAWIAYRRLARIAIEAYEGRLASDERLER